MLKHYRKICKGRGIVKINTDNIMDTSEEVKDTKLEKTNIEELKKQLANLDMNKKKDNSTKKKYIRF